MSTVAQTRTGDFPIGLRLTGTLAARPVAETAAWARANGFGCVDIYANQCSTIPAWEQAGMPVGTIDLFGNEWTGMLSADAGKRRATVALAVQAVRASAAAGAKILFGVMLAEDVKLPRKETFGYMVESYGQIGNVLKETGTRLAIEGWPGCNAHCCTPESYRAFLKEMNSDAFGINYDPSHLIRMGIDSLRFLEEFGEQVVHMHGKDTWLDAERVYELGREQDPVFVKGFPWGGSFWRYTVPGHGIAPWTKLLEILVRKGYKGAVSIELEDVNFNGALDGEQRGFIASRDFLQTA